MIIELQEEIDNKIVDFKSEMFNKYGITLYVYCNSVREAGYISLSGLWDLFSDYVTTNYPKYIKYLDLQKKTRKREWVTIRQCYIYIACEDLGFGISEVSRFLNCHHATILHSRKKVKTFLECADKVYLEIHDEIIKKYKEYVRTISENTEVRNNS